MTRRVGIFGGTFDPPHIGHLVMAVHVGHAMGLDQVLMMVANRPWQKVGQRRVSPAEHRLAMTAAAVEGLAGIEASTLEIERGGDSFTADTLATLRATEPDIELFVILGADAAAGLPTWKRGDEVRAEAQIVVAARGGEVGPPPPSWSWTVVDVPRLDVSSSDLRQRVREGAPIDVLVPPAVADLIARHGLYGDGS